MTLRRPLLADGQAFTVTVAYHGQPQPITDDPALARTYGQQGWLRLGGWASLSSANRPVLLPGFQPTTTRVDKATYSFAITVAKPYVVAANGVLIDELDHGASRTYRWAETRPMASYLATLAIAEFEIVTDQVAG